MPRDVEDHYFFFSAPAIPVHYILCSLPSSTAVTDDDCCSGHGAGTTRASSSSRREEAPSTTLGGGGISSQERGLWPVRIERPKEKAERASERIRVGKKTRRKAGYQNHSVFFRIFYKFYWRENSAPPLPYLGCGMKYGGWRQPKHSQAGAWLRVRRPWWVCGSERPWHAHCSVRLYWCSNWQWDPTATCERREGWAGAGVVGRRRGWIRDHGEQLLLATVTA
jgi:hypothetical protein